VASGADSFVAGINSQATQDGAIALGWQARATGVRAVAVGNQVTASNTSAFASGSQTQALGDTSTATGYLSQATELASFAHGHSAIARLRGMRAAGGGFFAAVGDAQAIECVLRNKTTTNAPATLLLDAFLRLTIPSGKILHATAHIIGSKSDGTAIAVYMRQLAIANVGGTVSLVGTVNTLGTDTAAGTTLAITADNTNKALDIAPTGVLSETWRWTAVVYGVEMAYGT
jgi:hypothetical protein